MRATDQNCTWASPVTRVSFMGVPEVDALNLIISPKLGEEVLEDAKKLGIRPDSAQMLGECVEFGRLF